MKHERRVVGHVSGWKEQMDTCVCGRPWPCTAGVGVTDLAGSSRTSNLRLPVKVRHEQGDVQPWLVDADGKMFAVVYRAELAEQVVAAINAHETKARRCGCGTALELRCRHCGEPWVPVVRAYANDPASCSHNHTGSCSPAGVYLYTSCEDCGAIVHETPEGKGRRENCPGFEPDMPSKYSLCKHCHHDYGSHVKTEPPLTIEHAHSQKPCPCKGHPFHCFNHPHDCGCTADTREAPR